MSYLYNGVFGLLGTVIVGFVVSVAINLLRGDRENVYDPNLFIPPLARRMKLKWSGPLDLEDVTNFSLLVVSNVNWTFDTLASL